MNSALSVAKKKLKVTRARLEQELSNVALHQ
jgi:hypothetical protein